MKTLSIRKFSIRKLALIALVVVLSACSKHDFDALEKQLPSIEKFAPLAELVEHHGSGTTIDLRDDPVRIEPPALAEQVSKKWLAELRQNDIELVRCNVGFGGTLFVKDVYGISISGSASGWVHFAKNEVIYANVVPDIDAYVTKVQEERPNSVEANNLRVVKHINDHWGIFLHTF